jgi:hypothetical protein
MSAVIERLRAISPTIRVVVTSGFLVPDGAALIAQAGTA